MMPAVVALLSVVLAETPAPSVRSAGACSPVPPSAVVEELKLVLAQGRFDDLAPRVRAMEAGLPCLDSFAGAHDLPMVYQLAATGALYGKNTDAAQAFFERAVVLGPNAPFDESSLGPQAKAAYTTARDRVLAGPTGELEVIGPVVVDGVGLQSGSRVFRPVGEHLVQVVTDDGVDSALVSLEAGQLVSVGRLDPEALAAEQLLWKRRQVTSFALSGALSLAAGGLYALAVQREQGLSAEQADEVDDAFEVARGYQRGSRLAMTGAALSLTGAATFGVVGVRAAKERSR